MVLNWATENATELTKVKELSVLQRLRRWIRVSFFFFIIKPFFKTILKFFFLLTFGSLTILWNSTLKSFKRLKSLANGYT